MLCVDLKHRALLLPEGRAIPVESLWLKINNDTTAFAFCDRRQANKLANYSYLEKYKLWICWTGVEEEINEKKTSIWVFFSEL